MTSINRWRILSAYSTPGTTKITNSFWDYFNKENIICEVGAGSGRMINDCLDRSLKVVAIDINKNEIAQLKKTFRDNSSVKMQYLDISVNSLKSPVNGAIMLGLLGALPTAVARKRALQNIYHSLIPPSIICISEFLLNTNDPALLQRYSQGLDAGLEYGSFTVFSKDGIALYDTHNFTKSEIIELVSDYFEIFEISEPTFLSHHKNKRNGITILAKAKE